MPVKSFIESIFNRLRILTLSVDDVHHTDGEDKDGNEITLEDTVGTETDELAIQTENKVLAETIDKILKEKLPQREYEILCMRYGLSNTPALTQREVAKKLGISRSYISRLENKALKTIKKDIKNKNLFM